MRRAARRRRWFVLAHWSEHQSGARDRPSYANYTYAKSYVLWNPTKGLDSKVPLAVASDGIHWDIPNQTFEVYFPNNRTPYKWATKRTVAESGLDKFGSSQPDNPRSTPAASMTYQMLWAFRLPDGRPQLGVITNSRTGIKPMKELFGMIDGKGVDHFFQRFRIQAIRISLRPGEYFFGYKYFAVDNSDMSEAEGDSYKALHERFRKAGFSTSMADEADVSSQPIKTFDQTRENRSTRMRFRFDAERRDV